MAQLANQWSRIFTVDDKQVLMFLQRIMEDGVRKTMLHTVVDLGLYNVGTVQFHTEFEGWLSQTGANTVLNQQRAEQCFHDIKRQLTETIKDGHKGLVEVKFEGH